MSALFGLMLVVGVAATVGLAVISWREHQLRQRTWQVLRVQFGRDTTTEAVLELLSRIASLQRGVHVTVELRADADGIRHYLGTDRGSVATLRGAARALLPSLRLEPTSSGELSDVFRSGRVVRLRGRLGVLRLGEHEATAAGLLAAAQPLGKGERLLIRWSLRPGGRRPRLSRQREDELSPEDRRLLRHKYHGSTLRARGLVAVDTAQVGRARHLLGRAASVMRARNTGDGYLHLNPQSRSFVQRELAGTWPRAFDRYAVDELAGLLGWPLDGPALPGVSLGTSPQLLPSARLPRRERILGTSTWPGAERPIAQPIRGALSHALISGPTGSGKSTLLINLMVQDLAAGRGLVCIDGKGDTAGALLARIPASRAADVIVLDCASSGALPGLKLFGAGDPELAADVVLGVLSDLFKDSWGPLSERYVRAGLVAVAADPAGTLADVPFVYSDATYRRRIMGLVRDPLTRSTLGAYEAMGASERQQQLSAPLGKLGSLLGRPVVRTVLGQAEPSVDFGAVLREGRIVVVSLAPTRVGAPAARLLGAVVVFALFQAVQARAERPERARRPFLVAIDEPKALGDLPMPLDVLLEQARGLGVGVTLAPQSLNQLPKQLREAVLTNAATRVAFVQNADDARLLARDLTGVTGEDLQDLAAFEAVARIGLGPGDVAPPVTIRTAPLTPATSDAPAIRRASAARDGQTLEQVDAALDARHGASHAPSAAAVGRRPRRAS